VNRPSSTQQSLRQEVASRFGLVPNFFLSAPDAPEIVERLWDFAKSAYLDNALPSLFKERLFVYLSRFCEMRYCITRHCAFLLGYGHSSGDPSAPAQTIDQVIRLLRMPAPSQHDVEDVFKRLAGLGELRIWPEPEAPAESWIIAAAAVVFVEPARAEAARLSLRRALGGNRFEHLMGLLTFVRAAHYWTVLHPEIEIEKDAVELLRCNETLRQLLLEDPEASRCDMGPRLFSELESLRDLHERRELEKVNRELQRRVLEREVLLKEVNHRIKNSLQIVSGMLHLQLPLVKDPTAADALRGTEARVRAIAAVHDHFYKDDDIQSIRLDKFLAALCGDIARAYGASNGVAVEAPPLEVGKDEAISIALIVNELVTNAFRHGRPPCKITVHDGIANGFKLTVADSGSGPAPSQTSQGLGTRIVNSLVQQLGGTLSGKADAGGYRCELFVPHQPLGPL